MASIRLRNNFKISTVPRTITYEERTVTLFLESEQSRIEFIVETSPRVLVNLVYVPRTNEHDDKLMFSNSMCLARVYVLDVSVFRLRLKACPEICATYAIETMIIVDVCRFAPTATILHFDECSSFYEKKILFRSSLAKTRVLFPFYNVGSIMLRYPYSTCRFNNYEL